MSREELSSDALSLLARARGADDASRAEVRAALQRFGDEMVPTRPARHRGGSKRLAWALAALTLSASVGALARFGPQLVDVPDVFAPPVETARPAALPEVPKAVRRMRREQAERAVPLEMDLPPPLPLATEPEPTRTPERAPVALPSYDSLSAELSLIGPARDALRAGDLALARWLVGEHARVFPSGALAQERAAIAALAECRAKRGATLGAEFVRAHPRSPFAAVVVRDCSLNPVGEPPSGTMQNSVPEAP